MRLTVPVAAAAARTKRRVPAKLRTLASNITPPARLNRTAATVLGTTGSSLLPYRGPRQTRHRDMGSARPRRPPSPRAIQRRGHYTSGPEGRSIAAAWRACDSAAEEEVEGHGKAGED